MDYEDIYLIINFETDDLAERMMRDADEKYPTVSDDEHVNNLLDQVGLSYAILDESFATIHNVDKRLYVRLEANNEVYTLTPLEYIQPIQKYLTFVNSFNSPKKVKVYDVSAQVGGIIDTNYGIKFKIKFIDNSTKPISKSEFNPVSYEDEDLDVEIVEPISVVTQASLYIKTLCGISSDDKSYDNSIDETLQTLLEFYIEGMKKVKLRDYTKSSITFDVIHRRGTTFYFGSLVRQYYGVVFLEDKYLIYNLDDGAQVNILCETKNPESAHIDIIRYLDEFTLSNEIF